MIAELRTQHSTSSSEALQAQREILGRDNALTEKNLELNKLQQEYLATCAKVQRLEQFKADNEKLLEKVRSQTDEDRGRVQELEIQREEARTSW